MKEVRGEKLNNSLKVKPKIGSSIYKTNPWFNPQLSTTVVAIHTFTMKSFVSYLFQHTFSLLLQQKYVIPIIKILFSDIYYMYIL